MEHFILPRIIKPLTVQLSSLKGCNCARNMDIIGVPGVEAEAELLAAIAMLLERLQLGPQDIAIKVSSRKVLQALLTQYGVPEASFGPVCIIVDKLDKLPAEQVGHLTPCTHALGITDTGLQNLMGPVHSHSCFKLNLPAQVQL